MCTRQELLTQSNNARLAGISLHAASFSPSPCFGHYFLHCFVLYFSEHWKCIKYKCFTKVFTYLKTSLSKISAGSNCRHPIFKHLCLMAFTYSTDAELVLLF